MGIIQEVQNGKVTYRTDKKEYEHLFTAKPTKTNGISIND